MDGFDKTMKFSIQDEKQSVHVNDVLLTVYDALQEKAIIRLTKSSVTY